MNKATGKAILPLKMRVILKRLFILFFNKFAATLVEVVVIKNNVLFYGGKQLSKHLRDALG